MDENSPTILDEAARVTSTDRRQTYGTPAENHARTAALWNAYLNGKTTLDAHDVCMLNILQKISRERHAPGRDNLVDIAGYARNIEMLKEYTIALPKTPLPPLDMRPVIDEHAERSRSGRSREELDAILNAPRRYAGRSPQAPE